MVDDYIQRSEALSTCRDICNGLKHYRLDPSRAPKNLTIGGGWSTTTSTLTDSGEPARWWFTDTPCGDWDMFALADECLDGWRVRRIHTRGEHRK